MQGYTVQSYQTFGLAFEQAMLKTDPDLTPQQRKGQAVLAVFGQVIETLEKEEQDGVQSGEAAS